MTLEQRAEKLAYRFCGWKYEHNYHHYEDRCSSCAGVKPHILTALTTTQTETAQACVEIAEDHALAPQDHWGQGARFNARDIANAIRQQFGLEGEKE